MAGRLPRVTPPRTPRLLRTLVPATGFAAVWLAGSPAAWALNRDDGDEPGPGLSTLETLLWFVGVPAVICGILALLVYAPAMSRGPRYRPGLTWFAEREWVGGPDGASSAGGAAGGAPGGAAGGASAASTASGPSGAGATAVGSTGDARDETGGASARW